MSGWLALVGTGPGAPEHLTSRALDVLAAVDEIVGYALYLDLLRPRLPHARFVPGQLTEEVARARYAVERALAGKRIALVSSGDAGIYGLAGLALELLAEAPGGADLPVEVVPGITALTAAAALLGAPLMADFAAVSLSDLLTPVEVIERRLHGAGAGDFVLGLYNPASRRRTELLPRARAILLDYRPPTTPVGLVRNAYRSGQRVVRTNLGDMPSGEVDMLTIVVVGNRATRWLGERMVTPRGYAVDPAKLPDSTTWADPDVVGAATEPGPVAGTPQDIGRESDGRNGR